MELTHIDEYGKAHMVNVGEKPDTLREAVAQAKIVMKPETLGRILDNDMKKGDVFACARIAGIMAAKRTGELIPLCHSLPIDAVEIEFRTEGDSRVLIRSAVHCRYHTGVEMEALTAASIAALTIYDMCKAVDRGMEIQDVMLLKKSGGKSGCYERNDP